MSTLTPFVVIIVNFYVITARVPIDTSTVIVYYGCIDDIIRRVVRQLCLPQKLPVMGMSLIVVSGVVEIGIRINAMCTLTWHMLENTMSCFWISY